MPTQTGSITPDGCLVSVQIALSRSDVRRRRAAGRAIPPSVPVSALVDPGAEITCIDQSILNQIALPLHGVTPANVPALGGVTATTQYDASVMILHPSGVLSSHLVIHDHHLTVISLGQLGYQMLIGRDILIQCLFIYDGTAGIFTLAY